jgi:hypothetical protein
MAALAALVAIGGCKSDEQQMAEAKKNIGDTCRKSPPPGIDADRFCTCVVDKFGSTSVADIKKMSDKESEALGARAATECLGQQGVGPGAAPAAAPPAQAPSEAVQETGEAVEEAVDETN